MKLKDIQNQKKLRRPVDDRKNITDGSYIGKIVSIELIERESVYTSDNKRVVLNIKVSIEDEEGENVTLYLPVNYSWSKKGNMVKTLEMLNCLPNPGDDIELDDLIGIDVEIIIENVERDGVAYANIISIKRDEDATKSKPSKQKEIVKKLVPLKNVKKREVSNEVKDIFNDDDNEESEEDSYEDLD